MKKHSHSHAHAHAHPPTQPHTHTHLRAPDHGGRNIVVENVLKRGRVLGRGGREARQGEVALFLLRQERKHTHTHTHTHTETFGLHYALECTVSMDSSERDAGSERETHTHLGTPDHGGRHVIVEMT